MRERWRPRADQGERELFPPDWLVMTDYTDTPLGTLKSGKESEVHLVARSAHGGVQPSRAGTNDRDLRS